MVMDNYDSDIFVENKNSRFVLGICKEWSSEVFSDHTCYNLIWQKGAGIALEVSNQLGIDVLLCQIFTDNVLSYHNVKITIT